MSARRRDLGVLLLCSAAVAAGAGEARRASLRAAEGRCFSAVNGLSDRAFVPVWTVMQLGSLGGSIATGSVVALTGRPALGRRLAFVGCLAWLGSKAIKQLAGRGRPTSVLDGARVRGSEQAGLGYPSGHAGVAAAMAAAAGGSLPRRARTPLWVLAAGVGTARVYVGAHLPLDVVGGAALGVATERALRLVMGRA